MILRLFLQYKLENNFVYQKALNISHQLFDYKINLLNLQRENTNSKGDLVLKNWVETFVLKISGIKNKSDSDLL